MSFGMRVWGADSALQLDENSFTMRVVHSSVVSLSSSSAKVMAISVPGITPSNGFAFVVPIGGYDSLDMQLETEVINDAVRVYNYIRGREQYSNRASSTMRLIAVRFS
jgi:hypothetical protein